MVTQKQKLLEIKKQQKNFFFRGSAIFVIERELQRSNKATYI